MIQATAIQPRRKFKMYDLESCKDKMCRQFHEGKVKGSTTYIADMDKCWTWRKQEFNLWTGYMNEGKSSYIRFLCLIKSLMDGWNYLFAAPEDFPPEEFYDDLVHTLVGAPTDRDNRNQMPEDFYLRAMDLIQPHIRFVYTEPSMTIPELLIAFRETAAELKAVEGIEVDGCVIDPLIKFSRPKDLSERDDIYAQHITSVCTDFCRNENISLHLVLHQLTPRLLENGYYPKPSSYNIKGGGTWADGSDNNLFVWRPEYAKDKTSNIVMIGSTKIKKQKLVGIPQTLEMRFDRRSNRYVHYLNERDLFDFDSLFQQRALR